MGAGTRRRGQDEPSPFSFCPVLCAFRLGLSRFLFLFLFPSYLRGGFCFVGFLIVPPCSAHSRPSHAQRVMLALLAALSAPAREGG